MFTEFFPHHILPYRAGVYEVKPHESGPRLFAYWSGSHWAAPGATPELAYEYRATPAPVQNFQWRGVPQQG